MSDVVKAYANTLGKELDELFAVNVILREDIQSLLDAYPDQWIHGSLQRALVRACWAHIEAITFGIKRITVTAAELGSEPLTANEHRFLLERSFVVDSSGQTKERTEFAESRENVKRTLKIACDKFKLEWSPNFGGDEWRQFSESLEIRHRVTHPTSRSDLDISEAEVELHRDAFLWFSGLFNTFLEKLIEKHGSSKRQATA